MAPIALSLFCLAALGLALPLSQPLTTTASLALFGTSPPTSSPTSSTTASLPTSSTTASSTASSTGTTTSGSPAPTSTPYDPDLQTVLGRRLGFITVSASNVSSISQWLSTLASNGQWPASEVDYTTGCPAQRANWPAQSHWIRILTMSAAWHGGLSGAAQWVGDSRLASAISSAMDFWFARDFTVPACLDQGGTSSCPCGTPGLWNTNWFSNVILIPRLVDESCLLFQAALTPEQFDSCVSIALRGYDTFYEVPAPGYLSGANILDIAKIGIDVALMTGNVSLAAEAYGRIHAEIVIEPGIMVDGIKPDGSFGQHGGLLYNGNYGKDYSNDVLELEIDAGGTQLAADATAQKAFETLIDGDQWMVYRNVLTDVLHWDFSTLPRFISFPVIDAQATGSMNINLTEIKQLGQLWDSDTMKDVYDALTEHSKSANVGGLEGNRNFYNNDYMVQRGKGYVTTLKMYSTRTKNTECTNSQNPLGFHLADGTLYTYLQGNEYEDIAASWDWNLIPGTTVDYGETPLNCNEAEFTGVEAFVGGVSTGDTGVAAMRYTNPLTGALSWQKAWFFLDDDTQHVLISNLSSTSAAPVYSVLDQKRHEGPIFVDGEEFPGDALSTNESTPIATLWHGNVGYTFDDGCADVSLSVGARSGAWSTIGTSTQPPETVDLFAAWISHDPEDLAAPVAYTIYPGVDLPAFEHKSAGRRIRTLQNDEHVSAVLDEDHETVSAVFWDTEGGTLQITLEDWREPFTISASGNAAVIYKLKSDKITVADPSQTLQSLEININSGWGPAKFTTIQLPTGGAAGSSVKHHLG